MELKSIKQLLSKLRSGEESILRPVALHANGSLLADAFRASRNCHDMLISVSHSSLMIHIPFLGLCSPLKSKHILKDPRSPSDTILTHVKIPEKSRPGPGEEKRVSLRFRTIINLFRLSKMSFYFIYVFFLLLALSDSFSVSCARPQSRNIKNNI